MQSSNELNAAKAILDSGKFEELIGTKESWDIEYKSESWAPTNAEDRFELAKDVAAMANTSLGMIVVGISTITLNNTQEDVVNGFKLVDISKASGDKLRQIISELIYPQIAISISAKPYHRDLTQGVLVIEILEGTESQRPYVVRKVPCGKELKSGGRELSDRYISFPRRNHISETEYPSTELVDWARSWQNSQSIQSGQITQPRTNEA